MPMENNVVLTPIKAVNKEIEACKICGSTTLPTRRTVLSNTKGKTKLCRGDGATNSILLQKLQVKAGNVDKEDK